jgi:hypothetical protein
MCMTPNTTVTVTYTMTPKRKKVLWFVLQNILLIRVLSPFGKDVFVPKNLEHYSTTELVYMANIAPVVSIDCSLFAHLKNLART